MLINQTDNLCYSIGKYVVSDKNLIEYIILKDFANFSLNVIVIMGIAFFLNFALWILRMQIFLNFKHDIFLDIPFIKKKWVFWKAGIFNPLKEIQEIGFYAIGFKAIGIIEVLWKLGFLK